MKDDRGVVRCDCCARQIVDRIADDEHTIGDGTRMVMLLGPNKHACHKCAVIERQDEEFFLQEEERRQMER